MKRKSAPNPLTKWSIVSLLSFCPLLLWGQYEEKCFTSDYISEKIPIFAVIKKDTAIMLRTGQKISAMLISGKCTFADERSCVRVVLRDDHDYDHLVYENYPLLAGSSEAVCDMTAIETACLDEVIMPKEVIIRTENASFFLESISYGCVPQEKTNDPAVRKNQCDVIARKLNENLEKMRIPWRAAQNRFTEYSFEEKKSMFGGDVPFLYGFDYYSYGVFTMPGMQEQLRQSALRNDSSQYVKEWDWRNRHGKNWLTSVKNQSTCGSCWAFAAVGVIEAYFNLYYNRPVNYDLSEQEIISCNGVYGCGNGDPGAALQYVKNNGVVKESCFHYMAYPSDCSLKCQTPDDIIHIEDYNYIANLGEDTIKSHVIKAPITMTSLSLHHVMTLVGFKVLEDGDKVYSRDIEGDGSIDPVLDGVVITDEEYPHYIGANIWLVINSWGSSWGTNGYGYIFTDISDIFQLHSLSGAINSSVYDADDVLCEDADGDGFYFWGIGQKPANCPWWVSGDSDGDDSDAHLGPMDQYGNITPYNPDEEDVIHIYSSQSTLNDSVYFANVVVHPNATWTIRDNLQFHYGARISVMAGGKVDVDGGSIISARMELAPGSELSIKNEGIMVSPRNSTFTAPVGALLNIETGCILR